MRLVEGVQVQDLSRGRHTHALRRGRGLFKIVCGGEAPSLCRASRDVLAFLELVKGSPPSLHSMARLFG